MDRRTFLATLAGSLLAPLEVQPQARGTVRRTGVRSPVPPAPPPSPGPGAVDGVWTVRSSPSFPRSPGAPAKHVRIIYDSNRDVVYLWGGDYCVGYPPNVNAGTRCDSHEEFWQYDVRADQWALLLSQTQANRTGYPRGRCLPVMQGCYDVKRKVCWMTGGDERWARYDPRVQSGGVWYFDPAAKTWTRYADAPKMSGGGSYELQYGILDPVLDQIVIATTGPFAGVVLHFDIVSRHWSTVTWNEGITGPHEPVLHGMPFVFDPTRRVGWLRNWCEMYSPCVGVSKLWTYSLDTRTWTLITSDSMVRPKATAGMAYEAKLDALVVFGGEDREEGAAGSILLNDTWVYDIKQNQWSKPNLRGAIPTPRKGENLCYLTAQDVLMVWGGNGFQEPGKPDRAGYLGPEVFLLKLTRNDPPPSSTSTPTS